MQNLAGHLHATLIATTELELAGIPVTKVESRGEVPSTAAGELHGFTFERYWCYWVVKGRMPLEVARKLYEDPIGREAVRVAGHCACPPPDEWAEWYAPDGARLYADPDGRQAREWAEMLARRPEWRDDAGRFVPDPSKVPGARAYVTSYHVDTGAGLRLLVEAIRELNAAETTCEAA